MKSVLKSRQAFLKKSPNFWLSIVSAAGALVLMAGCLEQDPYADQPDSVKHGIPPQAQKAEKPSEPVLSESILKIDAPEFYSFEEGQPGEIDIGARVTDRIDGRVLSAHVDFNVTVDNLQDFADTGTPANFDESTWAFSWTPPKPNGSQSEYNKFMRLDLTLRTRTNPVYSRQKSIFIIVKRGQHQPSLTVDLAADANSREGEILKFNVTVIDPDSVDQPKLRPALMAINTNMMKDVASLVYAEPATDTQPNPLHDANDPSKWTFAMNLDLRGQELTKTSAGFSFGMMAVSRFGETSGVTTVPVKILTNLSTPLVSIDKTVTVKAGSENSLEFTVVDPKGEGRLKVSMIDCATLPGVATCACKVAEPRDGTRICSVKWSVPAATPAGSFPFPVTVLSETKVDNDHFSVTTVYNAVLKVEAATPAATPTPSASPVPSPKPPMISGGRS